MIHENSKQSYQEQKAKGRSQSFRQAVYCTIGISPTPLTDREVMNTLKETDVNNIRPEITRLKQDGLLEEADKKTCQFTGKTVRTSKITLTPYFDRKS